MTDFQFAAECAEFISPLWCPASSALGDQHEDDNDDGDHRDGKNVGDDDTTHIHIRTRQSKQCGFSIYTFDNLKSKSMVRLVRAEKMVLSGLVFARKIARMILIQNI